MTGSRLNSAAITATYTPTDQSGATLTFTAISAEYTLVGNLVFLQGTVTFPITASSAGISLSIPFAAGTTGSVAVGDGAVNTTGALAAPIILAGASTMQFLTAALAPITNVGASNGIVRFNISYTRI